MQKKLKGTVLTAGGVFSTIDLTRLASGGWRGHGCQGAAGAGTQRPHGRHAGCHGGRYLVPDHLHTLAREEANLR